jgi:hypothetical protein
MLFSRAEIQFILGPRGVGFGHPFLILAQLLARAVSFAPKWGPFFISSRCRSVTHRFAVEMSFDAKASFRGGVNRIVFLFGAVAGARPPPREMEIRFRPAIGHR